MWAGPQGLSAAPQEKPIPAGGEGAADSLKCSPPALHREGAASHLIRPALAGKKGEVFFPDSVSLCHYLGWRRAGSSHLATPAGRGGQARSCCLTVAAAPRDSWVPAQGHFHQLTWAPHLCAGLPGSLPASAQHRAAAQQCSGTGAAGWTHSQGQFAFCTQQLPTDLTCSDSRGQTGSVPRPLLELNLKALSHCSAGAEPGSAQTCSWVSCTCTAPSLGQPPAAAAPSPACLEVPALLLPLLDAATGHRVIGDSIIPPCSLPNPEQSIFLPVQWAGAALFPFPFPSTFFPFQL